MVEAWTCYIILSVYVVPHKGRSRVNVYAHTCIYMYIHCTYYTYNVHGLCVSSIHSLIVCYLLHTHTQLLIDPRSSNEITNCCTSSLARICVFTGMVLVCVYLYTQCGASTLCSLSPTHTHCTETHAAVMDYADIVN